MTIQEILNITIGGRTIKQWLSVFNGANQLVKLDSSSTPKLPAVDGSLLLYLPPIFNPKDYGAVGDGVTNDQTAVQNCINAAHAVKGKVLFPQGIYLVNSLQWFPDVEMAGVGLMGTTLRSATAAPLIYYYNTANRSYPTASISDMWLDGNNIGTIGIDLIGTYHATFNRIQVDKFVSKGANLLGCIFTIWNKCNFSYSQIGVNLDQYVLTTYGQSSANFNIFNNCGFFYNTVWAILNAHGAFLTLTECDLEGNGTAANPTTSGGIKTTSMCTSGEGICLSVSNSWFEGNYGTAILLDSSAGGRSILDNVLIQFPAGANTTGLSVNNQKCFISGSTISGHTTDVLTSGSAAATEVENSTVSIHTESGSAAYSIAPIAITLTSTQYFSILSALCATFKTYIGTTANNQYAWFTNIRFVSGAWLRDDTTRSAWRMAQVVDVSDAASAFIIDYWTPAGVSRPIMTIGGSGCIGVGTGYGDPTALLQLKAGTTASHGAPLKFTSGANSQTTKEAGAVNYDGANLTLSDSTYSYTLCKALTATAVLDFPSTPAQSSSELTITVTGAADGDIVSVGVPSASNNANSCFTARVSAANTVTVKFNNYSSAAIDPASGTFKVSVIK